MRRIRKAGLGLSALLMLAGVTALARDEDSAPALQTVEVAGERAGPQMWRLSRGDHTVWIFGTLQPLPEKMTWRSKAVEDVLGEAQEVIPDQLRYHADIGLISGIRLYLQWRRIQELPHGTTLRQVLPPDLYARFSALRSRYGGSPRDLEHLQPLFAGARLRQMALAKSGLTTSGDVQKVILKLARKHEVMIRWPKVQVPDARGVLQEVGDMSVPAQLGCFEAMLSTLEQDMDTLKSRATAWTSGDVRTLVEHPVVNTRTTCLEAISGAPRLQDLTDQAHKVWMDAVENALATNRTSLAVQSIDQLLGPAGWLTQFRAAGYSIEGPDFLAPTAMPAGRPR